MEFPFSLGETFPLPSPPPSPSKAPSRPPSSVLLKSPFAVDLGPEESMNQNENANNPCDNIAHGDGDGVVPGEEDGSPPARTVAALSPISILKIGSDLMPIGGPTFSGPKSTQTLQYRVSEILDFVGLASAKAQGLRQPITSGMKLRMQNEHWVYLLIDRSLSAPSPSPGARSTARQTHSPPGAVLGMLKVGRKNLFLLDERGQQREMSPLCVLDFYVHEEHQRTGQGKRLFEHMMADLLVPHPRYLAVDKPSQKLIGFLRKHYTLDAQIPQTNNYTVYQGFFQDRPTDAVGGPRRMRIYMGKLQYI